MSVVNGSDELPACAFDMRNRERLDNLAKTIVIDARLEQGWEFLEGNEASKIRSFLRSVACDCLAEEKREMKALKIGRMRIEPSDCCCCQTLVLGEN